MNNKNLINLDNLESLLPKDFTNEEMAKAKTLLLKKLSYDFHLFYGGKIQMLPKAGIFGFNWYNVWYTPGVSAVSTAIRDDNDLSFDLSNRGNMVAVVSDSTRVLGDGNCSPSGGLGVMEGKALLMKMLGGVDAIPLCIDSRNDNNEHTSSKIIDFVKMVQPSFGAINLEDISHPNCYEVLDRLQEECSIPVWHDDAQGTASVTLAGLYNAIKLSDKKLSEVKIVYLGAGASNTSIARINIAAGMNPELMIMFDGTGALSVDREDIKANKALYRKWEICKCTNPRRIQNIDEAVKGADILIALSKPGPDVVKPEWIRKMAAKPIVFACANPVPEIYPYAAKQSGAFIVATGRGDFNNQINNSLGFPGILKGALLVRAKTITDSMAIAAAKSLAGFAEKRGINPDNIIPKMDETEVFPDEAAAVAKQAIEDGVARKILNHDTIVNITRSDINNARKSLETLINNELIKTPDPQIIENNLKLVVDAIIAER